MEDQNLGQPQAPAPAPVAPAAMTEASASNGKSSGLTWLLVVVVFAVVAYGIYYFYSR